MRSLPHIRRDIIISMMLIVATIVTYWQVGNHQFISLDDGLYIFENPKIRAGMSVEGIAWAFGFTGIAYWHPLTWISHMLDCQLFGLNAGRHHMMNLIFHLTNSLILFYLFRKITGDSWKSGVIATLFAVHPINVESVAWIAERKNVLSTFFWMLTLMSYSFYSVKRGKCPSEMMCIHLARSPSVMIAASAATVAPAFSKIMRIPCSVEPVLMTSSKTSCDQAG